VLLPGAQLPLHIFEPRYRRMLADCEAGGTPFGVALLAGGAERALPVGHVGCLAELRQVQTLPDGRSNVLVEGGARFALERFVESDAPYHVAEVSAYDDVPEPAAADETRRLAASVRADFARVAGAARTIAGDAEIPAELPDDDALVAFRVAALVDMDVRARQRLLVSRSPVARLREIAALLSGAVGPIEERAAVHRRARSNGHGPLPPGGP
jgi:Lon protease-like protein